MTLSLLALLLANAVPLLGALFFGWSVALLFALFWLESAVIGAFTVLKLLCLAPRALGAIPLAAFFCVHFGLFMFVHAVFLVLLVGGGGPMGTSGPDRAPLVLLDQALGSEGAWALLALVVSHGISFVQHFLLGGERQRLAPPQVMFSPYPRIVVMHVVILAGGFLSIAGGSAAWMLALLVVIKTAVDAAAHLAQHRGAAATSGLDPGDAAGAL